MSNKLGYLGYKEARNLWEYLWSNWGTYIKDNDIDCAVYEEGNMFLGSLRVDLSKFEYNKHLSDNIDKDYYDFHRENLFAFVDECANRLSDCFGMNYETIVEIDKGDVEYEDFLPKVGDNNWKRGKVPTKIADYLLWIKEEVLKNVSIISSVGDGRLYEFQHIPLMRLYMSGKGLTLGMWDSKFGSDDYYAEVYYGESDSGYIDELLEGIVNMVSKLKRPVKEIFILTEKCEGNMYYRSCSDGEYTITIF